MNVLRTLKATLVTAASIGLLIQQPHLMAAEKGRRKSFSPTAAASRMMIDVALSAGGRVSGQVLDQHHRGIKGAVVSIRQGKKEIARTVADKDGKFHMEKLRGGVYQVVAADGQGLFRLWAPHTAPPSARENILIVSGALVVRGQNENGDSMDDGTILYDEYGVPYGEVRISGGPTMGAIVSPIGYYGGLDGITLIAVGAGVTGAVFGGINLSKLNDLEDQVNQISQSP